MGRSHESIEPQRPETEQQAAAFLTLEPSAAQHGARATPRRRKPVPLGKVIGILLLAVALRAALDLDEQRVPDHVLAPGRGAPAPGSGAPAAGEEHARTGGGNVATGAASPQGLHPHGEWRRPDSGGDGEEFRWRWSGPPLPWCVVLLDENLVELARSESTVETRAPIPLAWAPELAPGERRYWLVEGTHGERRVASAPVPFRVMR